MLFFVDVPKHRHFVCSQCGGRNIKVMPIFAPARGTPRDGSRRRCGAPDRSGGDDGRVPPARATCARASRTRWGRSARRMRSEKARSPRSTNYASPKRNQSDDGRVRHRGGQTQENRLRDGSAHRDENAAIIRLGVTGFQPVQRAEVSDGRLLRAPNRWCACAPGPVLY